MTEWMGTETFNKYDYQPNLLTTDRVDEFMPIFNLAFCVEILYFVVLAVLSLRGSIQVKLF